MTGWSPATEPLAPLVQVDPVTISRAAYFGRADGYVIRGDTLAVQDELTACGCAWDPVARAWTADPAAAERLIAKLRGRVPIAEPTPAARPVP